MMNTNEAIEATNALTYGKFGTSEHNTYMENLARIKAEFLVYLLDEYAFDYNPEFAVKVIGRVWDYGHSSGYAQVEEAAKDHEVHAEELREEGENDEY